MPQRTGPARSRRPARRARGRRGDSLTRRQAPSDPCSHQTATPGERRVEAGTRRGCRPRKGSADGLHVSVGVSTRCHPGKGTGVPPGLLRKPARRGGLGAGEDAPGATAERTGRPSREFFPAKTTRRSFDRPQIKCSNKCLFPTLSRLGCREENSNSQGGGPRVLLWDKPVRQARGDREPRPVPRSGVQAEEGGRPCPPKRREWAAVLSGVTCGHVRPVGPWDASASSAGSWLCRPRSLPPLGPTRKGSGTVMRPGRRSLLTESGWASCIQRGLDKELHRGVPGLRSRSAGPVAAGARLARHTALEGKHARGR